MPCGGGGGAYGGFAGGVGGCGRGSGYVKYDDGACLLCILILGLIAIF